MKLGPGRKVHATVALTALSLCLLVAVLLSATSVGAANRAFQFVLSDPLTPNPSVAPLIASSSDATILITEQGLNSAQVTISPMSPGLKKALTLPKPKVNSITLVAAQAVAVGAARPARASNQVMGYRVTPIFWVIQL